MAVDKKWYYTMAKETVIEFLCLKCVELNYHSNSKYYVTKNLLQKEIENEFYELNEPGYVLTVL